MTRAILLGTTGIATAFAMLAFGYLSGKPQSAIADDQPQIMAQGQDLDRTQVEGIVRDYLLANPEILLEMQSILEEKQKEEQRVAQLETIKDAKDLIFNAEYDAIVGNPDGKVTIVEFYDYNCGYCKRAMEDMQALTKADPELRFVLKEFPILSPDSHKASVVSMAFHKMMPEKYGEFHMTLLGSEGRVNEAKAIKVALSLGADEAQLREQMKDPEIQAALSRTYDLANKLSITGTPSYVVGNQVVFGALGQQVLSEKIAVAKASL